MKQKIPARLVVLIRETVASFGQVLKTELGDKAFDRIETLRLRAKTLGQSNDWSQDLNKITSWTPEERLEVAHAFGLMLELINCCETAYRSHRLKQSAPDHFKGRAPEQIMWVLTAHPTEARSPAVLLLFQKIQHLLTKSLDQNLDQADSSYKAELTTYLTLLWHTILSKQRQPTVADEAEHIYSVIFQEKLFCELLRLQKEKLPLRLSTWVGGDKDGHSGVDEKTMLESLNLSRRCLVEKSVARIKKVSELLEPVIDSAFAAKTLRLTLGRLGQIEQDFLKVKKIGEGDGKNILALRETLKDFRSQLLEKSRLSFLELDELETIFELFPGLVVPLELREEAELIHEALTNPDLAISKMLSELARLSKGGVDPRMYARALVISQTNSFEDLKAGWDLVERYFADHALPVVPLLESEVALVSGPKWILKLGEDKKKVRVLQAKFNSQVEIMLGYSDSAKENGSLASRVLIYKSLRSLQASLKKFGLKPLFFHGSGGSVSRGGGPIKDQMSWWTPAAAHFFKATLQGEMIQRTFASPEILRSQVSQIAGQAAQIKVYNMPKNELEVLEVLKNKTESCYRKAVEDEDFLSAVEAASPYSFLHHLKIGSRPNKRKGPLSVDNLRAIPWVLCWTQMRVIFQVWWGIGTAWSELKPRDKANLKRAMKHNPVLSNYVHLMGFTLAKVELKVFKAYLDASEMDQKLKLKMYKWVGTEYKLSVKAFQALSGKKDFLWLRPWLGESIRWRSPMIHPLNLLQIAALKNGEAVLLRETVTGIASGMMTTG